MRVVLWIARILGGFMLAFIGVFVVAHIFGDEETGDGFKNTREVIMFICFPISTMIGLTLAYWKEGLGGLIVVAGIAGLIALSPNIASSIYFMLPVFVGVMYLVYWSQTRDKL